MDVATWCDVESIECDSELGKEEKLIFFISVCSPFYKYTSCLNEDFVFRAATCSLKKRGPFL